MSFIIYYRLYFIQVLQITYIVLHIVSILFISIYTEKITHITYAFCIIFYILYFVFVHSILEI